MAKAGNVVKIYKLETLGYDQLHKELQNVAKDFEAIKKSKLSAQGKLALTKDAAEVSKFSDEIAELIKKEQELRVETQRLTNEQKAANIQRQAEIDALKKQKGAVTAAAGSYAELYQQYRQLYTLVKNAPKGSPITFQGQELQFDAAIAKLKQLSAAEQDFRRQFARDGLLVAEYSSGIVQAFKQMGLGDLVGGQITKAQQRINDLNASFDRLQNELSETRVTGQGSLDAIEKEMVDNRKEVIALTASVTNLQREFRGAGDVGNQINSSLNKGFASLKGQIGSLVFQYVGFQAVLNKATSEISAGIDEATKIEGVTNAFENLNRPDLLDNLRTATRGTVSDLELMQRAVQAKNFQIPLDQLATLLDFARRRAKETGQEVNYLADSIVTGIGRKSPLILDNLGISAVRLREKFKGISDENLEVGDVAAAVAQIIQEENATAAKDIDTTSERLAKNRAEWQNIRGEFTKNLLPALAAIGSGFLFLITNLPTVLTLVGLLAAGWAIANQQLILQNAQLLYYNLLIVRNYIGLGILSAAQLTYNAILFAFNTVIRLATAGLRLFGITAATASGPLRILLTIASLLGAAFLGLSKALGEGTKAIDASTRSLRTLNEINKEANRISDEKIAKINSEIAIIKSSATSADTKRKAVEDLIKIDKEFSTVIKNNVIDLNELDKAYNKVTESIKLQARVQASAKLTAEKKASVDEISIIRQRIESEFARQQAAGSSIVDINELSKDERNLLTGGLGDFSGTRFTDAAKTLTSTGKGIQFLPQDFKNLITELKKEEEDRIKVLQDYLNFQEQSQADLDKFININTTKAEIFEVDIKKLKDQIEKLDKEIEGFQGSQSDLKKKLADRKKLQDELDLLLGTNKTKTPRASILSAGQKDAFKDIDALRDRQLVNQEIRFADQLIGEERYLKNVYAINAIAIDAKLTLLDGANAEERKQIADFNLDKIKLEQELNDKLFELRSKRLKDQFDIDVTNAKDIADRIKVDPTATELEKAQAQLDADQAILALQTKFNADMDGLEKDRNNVSIKNAEDRAREVRRLLQLIHQDEISISQAELTEIRKAGDKQRTEYEINYSKLRQAIINNDKLTATQRKRALENLARLQNFTLISNELAQLTLEFKKIEELYKAGLKTEQEYLDAKLKMEKAAEQKRDADNELKKNKLTLPSNRNIQDLLSDQLSRSFGFTDDSEESRVLGDLIAQSYSLATEAMNNFFNAERERIQENLAIQLERLENEKQQVIARAQTQEEIDSIEKQYAEKKKTEEKKAQAELKRSRKAEAKIALATELANIAVQASQYPFPASLVIGALLSALALGRYAVRLNEINSAKFEKGGQVPTRTGGPITGPSHKKGGVPFTYEAEGKELAIVNKKSAADNKVRTITGTNMQIASLINELGGGVSFAGGAKLHRFAAGGYLGESLQAPVFTPASTIIANGNNDNKLLKAFDQLSTAVNNHTEETSKRIDRIKVDLITAEVTRAQNKQANEALVGTL